jgi:hypothetical protein
LAIRSGKNGARLSHDHAKQYAYVLQSLTLWREILHGLSLRFLHMSYANLSVPQTCSGYGRLLNRTCLRRMYLTGYGIPARG